MISHSDHFFFSSRRRHTRSLRDWSSDVCSSDLGTLCMASADSTGNPAITPAMTMRNEGTRFQPGQRERLINSRKPASGETARERPRSEERRVGKEWRARGERKREKKKE